MVVLIVALVAPIFPVESTALGASFRLARYFLYHSVGDVGGCWTLSSMRSLGRRGPFPVARLRARHRCTQCFHAQGL